MLLRFYFLMLTMGWTTVSAHSDRTDHDIENMDRLIARELEYIKQHAYRLFFENKLQGQKLLLQYHQQVLETNWSRQYHIIELSNAWQLEQLSAIYKIEPAKEYVAKRTDVFQKRRQREKSGLTSNKKGISGYACYETVEETYDKAQRYATENPNLVSWTDIGDSQQKVMGKGGYDLRVMKITESNTIADKPALFIHAAMHAREYATAPLVMRFAEYLIEHFNQNADIQYLLRYNEVHLLFHMNPDGRKMAESGLSWRKNRNESYCPDELARQGADLNRNFTFKWNTVPEGSSGNECDITYRGPEPSSEPETQAVEAYMRDLFADTRGEADSEPASLETRGIHIDVHSFGELVIWPWGDDIEAAPNGIALSQLGHKLAYFNGYQAFQSSLFYPTDGTSEGASYGDLGIPHFTFEIGQQFFQDCETFENTIVPDNIPALLYALRVARQPYTIPSGPDVLDLTLNGEKTVTVKPGASIELAGRADPARGSLVPEPVEKVFISLNEPPWEESAEMRSVVMSTDAQEGRFVIELGTGNLPEGRHMAYVFAENSKGQKGAVVATAFTLAKDAPEPDAEGVSDSKGSLGLYWLSILLLMASMGHRIRRHAALSS